VLLSGGGTLFGGFPLGALGAFDLSAENVTGGILGDFSMDFSSDSVKDEEGLTIPEPSSWALALLGGTELGILDFVRRRRRRRDLPCGVAVGAGPVAAGRPPEGPSDGNSKAGMPTPRSAC
jgi:hypothetical protein